MNITKIIEIQLINPNLPNVRFYEHFSVEFTHNDQIKISQIFCIEYLGVTSIFKVTGKKNFFHVIHMDDEMLKNVNFQFFSRFWNYFSFQYKSI